MKYLTFTLIIFIIILFCQCVCTPGYTTRYKCIEKSTCTSFSDKNKNELSHDSIKIITTEDIRKYYLTDTSKPLWIKFVYFRCPATTYEGVQKNIELAKKYDIKLLLISSDFDIESVSNFTKLTNYPIFYIDPKYHNMFRKNERMFASELFNKEFNRNNYMDNFIIDNYNIIYNDWNVSETILKELVSTH